MTHMKTVSIRQMQHNLSAVMREIDQGHEVIVTRRKRPVARLVPAAISTKSKLVWPDFESRARAVLIKGPSLTQTLIEEREA